MLVFRWLILLALLSSIACFILYAVTGEVRFRHNGWVVLKWTLIAAFGFFGVLILERIG